MMSFHKLIISDSPICFSLTKRRRRAWEKLRKSRLSFTRRGKWTTVWTSVDRRKRNHAQLASSESVPHCSPNLSCKFTLLISPSSALVGRQQLLSTAKRALRTKGSRAVKTVSGKNVGAPIHHRSCQIIRKHK